MSRKIYVYAHWQEFSEPTIIGILRASQVRGREHFSFAYDKSWLTSEYAQQIDPDLQLYHGEQHGNSDNNFRVFLDSCPDRWGRMLMQRREAVKAYQEKRKPTHLLETDYLLGVHDMYRMGGIRFKSELNGPFLDDEQLAAPPISYLRDLEFAASQVEQNIDPDNSEQINWLRILCAPGSSLGGARPKSCVIDDDKNLWIAKFPSRYDNYDIAAWEYLVYRLALKSGITMSECRIYSFNSHYHTFLTKRFDRKGKYRLHFSSSMTKLGYYDGDIGASYLEIAQFLIDKGSKTKIDLAELWRRIIFNIAVSNSDDHLRNHGFLFDGNGWRLSPAYDINPVPTATGLHLNITEDDNRLDFNLAFDIINYFQLTLADAKNIYNQVVKAVNQWQALATSLKLTKQEQKLMEASFNQAKISEIK